METISIHKKVSTLLIIYKDDDEYWTDVQTKHLWKREKEK